MFRELTPQANTCLATCYLVLIGAAIVIKMNAVTDSI